MSPMSYRAPTGIRPSARRVLLLLCLSLCSGWLWAAVPVAAQAEVPPSVVETTGPYRNLAENHDGAFHLRREGGVVYATFQTDRSPVRFPGRDQPETLLTVPEGFRPAVAVTWEVSARPVRTDGSPHPDHPNRRVFRLRVDTAGQVRHVADPGMEEVGFLRYRTMLAWPLAGTEPRVCDRHWSIREGILAAVQALEEAAVPCSQVDWTHLARIRALSLDTGSENFARHDLLGLTNLATLQVPSVWAVYPDDLLAHTPRLQTLRIGGWNEALPGDLFRYTPLLARLSLGDDARPDADPPDDLLVHTPHLESLHLEGGHPASILAPLLAHAPRLTHLTVTPSTPLPETFLAAVPQLAHLTIKTDFDPCATPALLAPVPHLRHFTVRMVAADGDLACLDRALRLHAPDLAELHLELRDLQNLEAGGLPGLPPLTRLTLDTTGTTTLPAHLLARVPALAHLALHGGTLRLPAGFLAHTPRLTSLSLQVDRLPHLPSDLLAPVPDLQQVRLDTGNAVSLPVRFLNRVTELRVGNLPADFPMHAPHLEVLHLSTSLKFLPEGFLTYAPRLVELHLDVPSLRALPPTFLVHAPRLETFHLDAGNKAQFSSLTSFPEGFLTHAPSLVELHLRVPLLQAFPPSFLAHAPHLETLALENANSHPSPYPKKLPVTSLPANFLSHTPRLRHLDLEPLGHVQAFPPGFLSGAPQLRYLNLDARSMSVLPTDFLGRHPHLETIRLRAQNMPVLPRGFLSQSPRLRDLKLDLQRVEALPEGFLADTPRLWNLELDVQGVETLPPGFLAEAPQLIRLNLRAHSLTAWPADFLADAPRIRTLGLAMPLLEPTLTPEHRLWETLQTTSLRVKVIRPDPVSLADPDYWWEFCTLTTISKLGSILEVSGRAPDDRGRMLLRVSGWEERELFAFEYWPCPVLIDSRFTAPTLEVCAAYRDPNDCDPVRVPPYGDPDPDPFRG